MDHLEMVEKLRERVNVSYAEARDALEASDWDMLDALVLLESEGKGGGAPHAEAHTDYTTRPAAEDPRTADKENEIDFRGTLRRVWKALLGLIRKGNVNYFTISRKQEKIASVPITVLVAVLIFVWPFSSIALIVGLFLGCRYHFSGPNIGQKVNDVMDKTADVFQKDEE